MPYILLGPKKQAEARNAAALSDLAGTTEIKSLRRRQFVKTKKMLQTGLWLWADNL